MYSIIKDSTGNQCLVKLLVEEAFNDKMTTDFSRAYELQEIKKVATLYPGVHSVNRGLTRQVTTNYSISDLFALVKQYDKSFNPKPVNEIFLNEDGTPKKFITAVKKAAVLPYLKTGNILLKTKHTQNGETDLSFKIRRLEYNFNRALSEAQATKNFPTESGVIRFSGTNQSIIDLSNDNELPQMISGVHGSKRYDFIRSYILQELQEQPITLNDGKIAVVDRNDATYHNL